MFRPLGGVIFGHVGDKFGCKIALTISIIGMVFSTLMIALLLIYSQIGVWAPILLVVICIFQGICIGGEGAGSAVFILERCNKNKFGFLGSIVIHIKCIWYFICCYY